MELHRGLDELRCPGNLPVCVESYLKEQDRQDLLEHVRKVVEIATQLATSLEEHTEIDTGEAVTAAWLHDTGRTVSAPDALALAEENGRDLMPEELARPDLLHGYVSRCLAKSLFGVHDPEVLTAVEHHTTLRAAPSVLEKLLFVADKLSWPGADAPFRVAMTSASRVSLDHAVRCYLGWAWARRASMPVIHPDFRAACQYFGVV